MTERAGKVYERVSELLWCRGGEALFYFALGAVYFKLFWESTMFDYALPYLHIIRLIWYIGLILMALFSGLNIIGGLIAGEGQTLFMSALIAIGSASWLASGYKEPFIIALAVTAGAGRDFKRMLLITTVIGSILMVAAYLASTQGMIPDLTYERGGGIAHALGIRYRTDHAAHVLYLIMSYAALRRESLRLPEYLLLWLETYLVWRYTLARCDCACMAFFLTVFGVFLLYKKFRGSFPELHWSVALIHVLCFLLTLLALWRCPEPWAYDSYYGRLLMSREALQKYGVKLLGQRIYERGAGSVADSGEPYFYLDISYVRTLILFGALMLLAYLALMSIAAYRAALDGEAVLALALFVVALASLMEHHAMELGYNVFILAGGTLTGKKNDG